jgi:hypothetical protein
MKPHNHEAVKEFEANSRDNEQIHGGNVRRVVSQKGPPSLAGRPGNFLQLEGGAAHHRAVAETLQHDPSALIAETIGPRPHRRLPQLNRFGSGSHQRSRLSSAYPSGQSATSSTSVHGRTNRRHQVAE